MEESRWRAELDELLAQAELDALDAAQSARLNDLLREHDGALEAIVESLEVDALLRWHHGVARPEARIVRRPRVWRVLGLATAAAALFAIAYLNWGAGVSEKALPEVAAYQSMQTGNWAIESHRDAQFEVVSQSVVRLARGELLVRSVALDPGALVIETPGGRVQAEGTEFYVGAHERAGGLLPMKTMTRVLVLSGTVALSNSLGSATAGRGELLVAEQGSTPVALVARANNAFGFDLYKELAKAKGENLFFSPYSISLALAMTMEGARGETAAEFGNALHVPGAMRRVGAEAQRIPFQLGEYHTGHSSIQRMLEDARLNPEQVEMRKRRALLIPLIEDLKARIKVHSKAKEYSEANHLRRELWPNQEELADLEERIDSYRVVVANALFGEQTYPFNADYARTIRSAYGTGAVRSVDFMNHPERERRLINDWVSQQTETMIPELIAPELIDSSTSLVLLNAIYFRGNWSEPFEQRWTKPAPFTRQDGASVEVAMMHRGDLERARYGAFNADGSFFETPHEVREGQTAGLYPDADGFELAELQYQGGDLSMLVLLPRAHTSLDELEGKLTAENIARWLKELQQRDFSVKLPAFESHSSFSLRETLERLGVRRAFVSPAQPGGAEFDGMTDSDRLEDQLYLSAVVHQAKIRVNEEGSEAAAATAVIARKTGAAHSSVMPFAPEFHANRPFLYLIRDKNSGTILFLGRFADPG